MVKIPKKGEIVDVNISPEGKRRLQVGLSWDTQEKAFKTGLFKNKTKKIVETYDLDISCYIFDNQDKFLEVVSPENSYMMDRSEQIYHSGDNTEGHMPGDDEFISINIANLPDYIHKMVFIASSPGRTPFGSLENVVARVADGRTNETQLSTDLAKSDKKGQIIFVFAGLFREPSRKNGWALKNISEFSDSTEIEELSKMPGFFK